MMVKIPAAPATKRFSPATIMSIMKGRWGVVLRSSGWKEPALNRLVSAPVLVTTVDHLMPATEGVRGGRQIPAMLRLLTSDLVLDEPDDFDIDDLHALCRLVNWAGCSAPASFFRPRRCHLH
jgi:hypothetical protein